ncbi:MAG TPA: rhomboid family intramembrane serine protease [Paracoccaceae bacterium]|nr:rhomboid family intramembrane serine protease [Paracoccaceae bacterium]
MNTDRNAPPLNPLPPVVWILALPLIAMEAVLSFGAAGIAGGPDAVGWRIDAMQRFAFSPELFRAMWDQGTWPQQGVVRFVTYPLVHWNLTHALFVVVFLLALGKYVGEVFRWWALLAVVVAASVIGAAVYGALPFVKAPLVGGYPGVYGLIGAFTFILWARLGQTGANRARAFVLIGFLLGVEMLFGLLFGGGPAWIANLAGFATGFALSFVVSPGGWRAVLARLRAR